MHKKVLSGPLSPPPGRPSWGGREDLPLIYLGWGLRDFLRDPVAEHYDRGANYYVVLRGEIVVTTGRVRHTVRGPAALLFDPECVFGLTQRNHETVEILVWIWKGRARTPELRPKPGEYLQISLRQMPGDSLIELHTRCRGEVARADSSVGRTLTALRELVEVEILRASKATPPADDVRWKLASSWMLKHLCLHAPVPALCDYLRMSPSTLHRFFVAQVRLSPGAYFHKLKSTEARRLIEKEHWQLKAAAYHLGYRHANDLSRMLSKSAASTAK